VRNRLKVLWRKPQSRVQLQLSTRDEPPGDPVRVNWRTRVDDLARIDKVARPVYDQHRNGPLMWSASARAG
jgi:hypothetical protein